MGANDFNLVIIGGGVIGCALARELASRFQRILLLEKESSVGQHASGRNSGVVHSGFNATPGTLKARLCVEGNKSLREYCRTRGVPCEDVGTWVVAPEARDLPKLVSLKERGQRNGVPGLEILSGSDLRQREPNARGEGALYSPTGAIVDSQALTLALANEARDEKVTLVLADEALQLTECAESIRITTRRGTYTAQLLINCAGLHSDRIAHAMGVGRDYIVAPFRGEYFSVKSSGKPLINSMLYDIPNPQFPFLGIHVTRTISGSVLLGPNAVPAFGREAYSPRQVNLKDVLELLRHRGFWNALLHNRELFKLGWRELRNSYSKRHFLLQASRLVNGLTLDSLTADTRVGIRPQLIRSDGRLVDDLVIETTPRSVHILNVVSPGMTSALAFARWISEHITDQLAWTRRPAEVLV
ncbi:MAG: hypothetical protein A2992_10015 [Elusimicrobia bacterium RIFCSPLOWO2_01_FULL_59_12]|nr:MAG: hypothetical protein A2992_10015 [Elusimicrobia bacterium RIFCSPLOWO2_01_FULL_59_12]